VTVSEFSPAELASRLGGSGLFLTTGPFTYRIASEVAAVSAGLASLYGDFPCAFDSEFADFHVNMVRRRGWRSLRPLVDVQVGTDFPSSPLPIEQAFAIFEGCLNWCIYTYAHQYLIIHAAAVERGGRAVILPAPPGSGKSTLCAALVCRGWRLLTDELTLIDLATRSIVPLARPVSLKNESIGVLRQFAPEAVFGPVSSNTIKGTVVHTRPPADSVRRVSERGLPAWIVRPKYVVGQQLTARKISPGESFMMLAASSVNYMLHGAVGFDLLIKVVDSVESFALEYSDLDSVISWFEDLAASDK
jgi:hypothetical protein